MHSTWHLLKPSLSMSSIHFMPLFLSFSLNADHPCIFNMMKKQASKQASTSKHTINVKDQSAFKQKGVKLKKLTNKKK